MRTRVVLTIGLLLVLSIVVLAGTGCSHEADRAYINGTIYTVDEDFSTATALAIKDGEFIYVGDALAWKPISDQTP